MTNIKNIENVERYLIHSSNIEALKVKIEKLNKKANKLNVPSIEINEIEIRKEVDPKTKEVNFFHLIEINGEAPKLNGWKFVARIETIKDNRYNLIFVAPNESVPSDYRETGSTCDHCSTNRYRKYTYILKNENGEYKQVGSSCLKDFLGHTNPHSYANYLEWIEDLIVFAEDSEEYDRSCYGVKEVKFDLTYYVSYVAEYIKQTGYFLSRSKAQEFERISTADSVWNEIHNRDLKIEHRVVKEISEESNQLAKDAIEWAISLKEKENLSDYQHNLQLSCEVNAVDWRSCGIVASLITAYQYEKEMIEKKERIKEERKDSEYFGKVGEREVFTLEVLKKSGFSTQYGWTTLHIFKDQDGNIATWFSSNKEFEVGEVVTLNATVKEHKEYEGTKQTVLTRCNMIKKKQNKVS
jgi:hypothetical protein